MIRFLLLGLGTWAVWEWVLSLLPFRVPAVLQLPIVAVIAWGLYLVPDERVGLCLGACALVAILHQAFGGQTAVTVTRPRRSGGLPK